jgi:gas vesicle protein
MSCGERHYSAGAVAVSFLLGGAVGAGLAVLLTPRSGPETRERIREQATTVRGEALRVADDVRERASELLEKSKGLVEEKKAILESALDAGKEAMEREKERLMARIKTEPKEEGKAPKA